MAIFSTKDRSNVMNEIVSFAEQNEHIMALIAVGSGAYGYIDERSDLDMVMAIDSDENLEAVMAYVATRLKERLNLIYFKQIPQRRLQVYVSDHFLEIDIGYGVYTSAAAYRKDWKVLFDKTGTVDEAMRKSWERHEGIKAQEHAQQLAAYSDVVWHNLMHAAVAIRRGRHWRAVAELDLARNGLIGLLGRRYERDTDRNREVDLLPEAELNILKTTLVTGFSPGALWSRLAALTDAVYDELERYGERACITVTRHQVREYIHACRDMSDAALT